MKKILAELIKAMKHGETRHVNPQTQVEVIQRGHWYTDDPLRAVVIETPDGHWFFQSQGGRKTVSYLSEENSLKHYRLYPHPIPFDDLVTLAHIANMTRAAALTAEEDIRHTCAERLPELDEGRSRSIDDLYLTVSSLREQLNGAGGENG